MSSHIDIKGGYMAKATILTRANTKGVSYTVYAPKGPDGKRASLGTFRDRDKADRIAASYNEASVEGVTTEALMTLSEFVRGGSWETHTPRLEPNTRSGYRSYLENHILPVLGHKKVKDVTRRDVQGLMDTLKAQGKSDHTQNRCKMILSSLFSVLVRIEALEQTPVYRINAPRPSSPDKPGLLPEEVKKILDGLPNPTARLFAHVLIETGARYGEAAELRKSDIDWRTGTVFIRRAVADVGDKFNPNGTGRFYIKLPKSNKGRMTTVSEDVLKVLRVHVETNSIGNDDLMFPLILINPEYQQVKYRSEDVDLSEAEGLTEPNEKGYRYEHGTTTGYGPGGCRCEYCTAAVRMYRRSKRTREPVVRTNETGHLPRDVWRKLWVAAVEAAKLGWSPTTHDLRHAHATWLLKNGVDLFTVKDRLGHQSIVTTDIYLRRIRMEDSKASNVIGSLLS